MTPRYVRMMAEARFGGRDPLMGLARAMGTHIGVVRRWADGSTPITDRVATMIRSALQ